MNLRIRFNKGKEIAFISHLDLLRTFNRMLIRSGLKLGYSQGYNPHILIAFAKPSSVGMLTENDCADITLAEDYSVEEVFNALKLSAPAGLNITDVTDKQQPSFNSIAYACYSVLLNCNKTPDEIMNFLRISQIMMDKKTKKGVKEIDIKPLMMSYELKETKKGIELIMTLKSGNEENLNPVLVIRAMEKYIDGFKLDEMRITRKHLLTDKNEMF